MEVEAAIAIQVDVLENFVPLRILFLFESHGLYLFRGLQELIAGQRTILIGVHGLECFLQPLEIGLLRFQASQQGNDSFLELVSL